MHTLKIHATAIDDKVYDMWINHNPDWSGEAFVNWRPREPLGQAEPTTTWEVARGYDLVTGCGFSDNPPMGGNERVPYWVVALAVSQATKHALLQKFVRLAEDLA